jgi:DNA-directed RNA polymerase subunit RPC12/RpoP
MVKKYGFVLLIIGMLIIATTGAAAAQGDGETLQLGMTRDYGYGGLGKIQGNFSLKIIKPPPDLARIEYYFDSELIATLDEEPFRYKFHTSDFSSGDHSMSAVGYLENGEILESNQITKEFLSSGQAQGETRKLIGPILIGTAVLSILGVGIPLLFSRNKEFVLGKYGPAGGVVCTRCGLPFSRSILSPNLLAGKLVRCPHCGKISILARASQDSLNEAEAKFTNKDTTTGISGSENKDLNKLIDDSRFED